MLFCVAMREDHVEEERSPSRVMLREMASESASAPVGTTSSVVGAEVTDSGTEKEIGAFSELFWKT